MMITKERIETLAKYLGENEERATLLTNMCAEEACLKINADGYDFTAEELSEFAQCVVDASNIKDGEIDEAELDNVSGGVAFAALCAAALFFYGVSCAASVAKTWLRTR